MQLLVSNKINCKYLHTLLYQVFVKSIALHVHLVPQLKDKLPETKNCSQAHRSINIAKFFRCLKTDLD